MWDEGGLPAPDPVTGQITLTDDDVSAEADFMASYYSVSYDDIFVIFTPSNAPPPISIFCGQHFVTSNDRITAWVAYPQGGCSFSNQQAAVMHEITEATANPAYNDGTSYEGWDQGTGATCEIGDLCNGIQYKVQTQPASNTPSQITTQQEFSNEAVAAGKERLYLWAFNQGLCRRLVYENQHLSRVDDGVCKYGRQLPELTRVGSSHGRDPDGEPGGRVLGRGPY